eukprot:snap_masked-scaffold_2-processed-gene-27.29-mRNA-1 protein AED:0.94 eAED:1.00 QI:0/-1/0/1/-1/1/1/0/200
MKSFVSYTTQNFSKVSFTPRLLISSQEVGFLVASVLLVLFILFLLYFLFKLEKTPNSPTQIKTKTPIKNFEKELVDVESPVGASTQTPGSTHFSARQSIASNYTVKTKKSEPAYLPTFSSKGLFSNKKSRLFKFKGRDELRADVPKNLNKITNEKEITKNNKPWVDPKIFLSDEKTNNKKKVPKIENLNDSDLTIGDSVI